MMTPSRLFPMLLAGLFFLHVMVAGSGYTMGMGEAGGMQTMQSAVALVSSSDLGEDVPVPPSNEAPCSSGVPCDMPGMPPGCASVLPCASATSLPARLATFAFPSSHSLRPVLTAARAPHTRLSPPELPPPRA